MSDSHGNPSTSSSAGPSAVTRSRIDEARTRLAGELGRTLNTGPVLVDPKVFFAEDVVWTCDSLQTAATLFTTVAYSSDVSQGTAFELLDLAHMFQQAHDGQCP